MIKVNAVTDDKTRRFERSDVHSRRLIEDDNIELIRLGFVGVYAADKFVFKSLPRLRNFF